MKELSNADKSKHGAEAKIALKNILLQCRKFDYIKELIEGYKCGYEKYDSKQFSCNFVIVFKDDTKWIVNITTSFRSDRLKENQWDSYNIKEIDKSISKSILTYPDGLSDKEKSSIVSYRYKIENHIHFSAVDNIVSQTELFELIESFANKNLSVGQKKDKQGNNFEKFIAEVLSDDNNLFKWKTENRIVVGRHFDIFKKVMSKLKVNKENVNSIRATSEKKVIGHLMTSGSPKTDIIVRVYSSPGKEVETFTISCKRTSAKAVSIHQYSADAFADVLDEKNDYLRSLLREFQKVGNLKDFGKQNYNLLSQELKPYLEKLVRWVLGGYGGKNLAKAQLADYILIYDENEVFIYTLDEYTSFLLRPENVSHFGTPFSWTFASGRKGKDIQLKCKTLKKT